MPKIENRAGSKESSSIVKLNHDEEDKDALSMLPLLLLEPDYDDQDHWLQSFLDIKFKTNQTLYEGHAVSTFRDKSPKGSVDARIQALVDLINHHPSFSTLSSCSGRISLFDPNGVSTGINEEVPDGMQATTNSGKGQGGWLLVSHEEIEPKELLGCFPKGDNHDGSTTDDEFIPLVFKHEPLLLHVAAACLQRGRQLLNVALQLGFRESGLVVSDSRVTVHIRGQSLALCVPLGLQGPLRPPTAYLESLVVQANQRLRQNLDKLHKLYQAVQTSLFASIERQTVAKLDVMAPLPDLNLWGHASVIVPNKEKNDLDVLVFGGYGRGPTNEKASSRSDKVYRLERRLGEWSQQWKHLAAGNPSSIISSHWGGSDLSPTTFPECQGVQGCFFSKWILLWGGRCSPTRPLNTIYLFDHEHSIFATPGHVIGKPPSARWGHTLTRLSEERALIAGGCTSEGVVDGDLHIIYLKHQIDGRLHVRWETLTTDMPPRFYHSTVIAQDSVFVFGGQSSTTNLLEAFESTKLAPSWTCRLDDILQGSSPIRTLEPSIDASRIFRFGASSCSLSIGETDSQVVVITGGLAGETVNARCDASSIQYFSVAKGQEITSIDGQEGHGSLDFGSMVHHQCLPISSEEFLLLGGGVASFAFGDSFAKYVTGGMHVDSSLSTSYSLIFSLSANCTDRITQQLV
jgi:tRNA wybutosine-synthesizing protein 3